MAPIMAEFEFGVFVSVGWMGKPGGNPQEQGENHQQLDPMEPGRNQTRATLVGRESSHHCAMPASQFQ